MHTEFRREEELNCVVGASAKNIQLTDEEIARFEVAVAECKEHKCAKFDAGPDQTFRSPVDEDRNFRFD